MLSINTLLTAYRAGFFPMAVHGHVDWYSPDQRGIIPLEGFHVSRRLARVLRQRPFTLTINRSFRQVMLRCASRRDAAGSWIDDEIVESYCALHEAGYAHSVEAWRDGTLAGGLYGVSLRGAFFGESMFHSVTDASKVALAHLVSRLRDRDDQLLDVQWVTPHLARMGAVEVSRSTYLRLLADAMTCDCRFV